jgi:hypothetical protein
MLCAKSGFRVDVGVISAKSGGDSRAVAVVNEGAAILEHDARQVRACHPGKYAARFRVIDAVDVGGDG